VAGGAESTPEVDVNLPRLLGALPVRFQWTLHNVVAHPLSEVAYQLTGNPGGFSAWIHDVTSPLPPRKWGQSYYDRPRAVYLSAELRDPTRIARAHEVRDDEPRYPVREG